MYTHTHSQAARDAAKSGKAAGGEGADAGANDGEDES